MKPVVSVVIPVWQAEKTLRRCVESLVLGVEQNIQVILVDDASRDGSWALCEELASSYPQVQCIRNWENRGVSYTRNRGLAQVQADYVLFVDSDDWVSADYIPTMVSLIQKYPQMLPICGFHFIDRVTGIRQQYGWETDGAVRPEQYVSLMEKTLLQTLWNKIFRRDIIKIHHLRFDETQSMGEDFQFVLDYMEAAKVSSCMLCNQPLYYYIRHNRQSLMSRFGVEQLQQEQIRIQRLWRLSGLSDPAVAQALRQRVENNFVYHILRKPDLTKEEKRRQIREQGLEEYHSAQKRLLGKERAAALLTKIRMLPSRMQGKFQRNARRKKLRELRRQLQNPNACLISQNCIGGVFSHDMGLPFLSPTVDLFFSGEDFVRFAQDLPKYLAMEPEMYWQEAYPMGKLGDVTIHFMHYDSCKEAKEAWLRRAKRVVPEQVVLLCTDMEGFTQETFAQWQQLPYPKVLFTAREEFARDKDSVYFPEFSDHVPDLIPERLFYREGKVLQTVNFSGEKKPGNL